MKCWNSAFNAQRLVTNYSCCTVRSSENICGSSEWRRSGKRKDRMKLSLPRNKVDGFLSFIPRWMLMYLNADVLFVFAGFFLNLTVCMTKLRLLVLVLLASFISFLDEKSPKADTLVPFFPKGSCQISTFFLWGTCWHRSVYWPTVVVMVVYTTVDN